MIYMHPVFMTIIIVFIFKIRALGEKALAINPKSPEAGEKDILIAQHKKLGIALTVMTLLGAIGGIGTVIYVMKINEPFIRTYGHGFIGIIFFSLMATNIFIGKTTSKAVKEKARKGLLNFHKGIFYFTIILATFSVITGLLTLIKGPSPLE